MMSESIPFLITGISFGLAAGVAPGPLLTLVISETLRHNRKQGILVAIAPILTDVPIIILSVYILSKLSGFNIVLGVISLMGASFVGYLTYESITVKGVDLDLNAAGADSRKKGVITNFLSPHPYLFWMAVGSPVILKAYAVSPASSICSYLDSTSFSLDQKSYLPFSWTGQSHSSGAAPMSKLSGLWVLYCLFSRSCSSGKGSACSAFFLARHSA